MGLFDNLFGKRAPKDALIAGCIPALDETERVYRNQLEDYDLSGVGLLKARLFTASFMAAAYVIGGHARSEDDASELMQACSGGAMRPFGNPMFRPAVSREQATSFASRFMTKILKLVREELQTGPSTFEFRTTAFEQLINIYHHCLAETVGSDDYNERFRDEFAMFAEQAVWSNLRLFTETIDALR